jgi:hypothetical protein
LLVALALLALAAALLAGSAMAGRAMMRSTQSHGASITAESEARTALAEFVSAWSTAYDSLQIGRSFEAEIGPRRVGAAGLVALTRFRVLRVSSARYVVGLETSVGPLGLTTARRRLSLLIARQAESDSATIAGAPVPIGQWSLADLF